MQPGTGKQTQAVGARLASRTCCSLRAPNRANPAHGVDGSLLHDLLDRFKTGLVQRSRYLTYVMFALNALSLSLLLSPTPDRFKTGLIQRYLTSSIFWSLRLRVDQ